MKIRFVLSCIFFVLAAGLLFLPSCRKGTDEDKVRNTIRSIQKAAENKDVREMLEHISKKYTDLQGNDYEGIKGIIVFYFFRHQKITVFLNNLEITVNGPAAQAAFEAVLSGGTASGTILPEALGAYRFTVSFVKESGEWKVISARWERPGEGNAEER